MSTQKSSVRIIGGEHKSRRLHFTDQGGDIRPTSDRLRETLFNWLQFDLPGSRVLDLYAGSGILAAEALSRGAASAELVELNHRRANDLRQQLTPLFNQRAKVHSLNALDWLQRQHEHAFNVVFVDPPYDLGVASESCNLLVSNRLLTTNALVYVETRSHELPPDVPNGWMLHREKIAGEAAARLYTTAASP